MAQFLKKIKALTLQEYEALPYSERVRTDVLYFTRDTDTGELTPVTDPELYEAVLLVDQNGEPLQDQDGRYIVPEDEDGYTREQITHVFNVLNTDKQDKLTAGDNITIVDNIISVVGGGITVENNLTSTSTTAALSANQGRVLNEKIDTTIQAAIQNTWNGEY